MSQNISSLITSTYNARKTLLEQLRDQDYNIDPYANFGINEVNIMYQNSALDMILEKEDPEEMETSSGRVYVRYFAGRNFRPNNVRELVDDLLANDTIKKTDSIIFITAEDSNDTIKEFVKQLWEEESLFIILLSTKRLQFNVLSHVLVPPHTIISERELVGILSKYKLKDKSLLPELSRFDPVALSIGMRPGDVCKIVRPSKTSVNAYYYRLCVNN